MAKKLAWLYGKRGFMLAAAVLAAALNAKGVPFGFFDGA